MAGCGFPRTSTCSAALTRSLFATQVLAEQHAKEHAELAVRSMEGIRQELMTLDGSSSMLDSDSLIDLTDDMEDVPGGIATGEHCQSGAVTAPPCNAWQ